MCVNEKFGHILGTRSIKTAGFSWDLQGISIEENAYKSSNTKASWKLLTIAKTRARKLEIKCSDELPWVRIPPSLPVKSRLSSISLGSLFLYVFLGEKQDFGHILGTRDFELVFRGCEICGCDIEKEDAVQHPQIRLCITFELLGRSCLISPLSGRKDLFCLLSCVFFAECPCLWRYPYPVICMDRRDERTILWRTVHHFFGECDAPFSVIGVPGTWPARLLRSSERPWQLQR